MTDALSEILPRHGRPRAELVRLAHSIAASLFVGRRKLPPALVEKAKIAAFNAILRHDRLAGSSHHSYATHSHHVAEIAAEGVEEARVAWARLWRKP